MGQTALKAGPATLLQMNQELLGIVRSGIPLNEGLRIAAQELRAGLLSDALADVEARVRQGASLSEAMAGRADVFSPEYRSLITVGERMGSLTGVLEFLINHYRRQVVFREQLRTAAVYPATVLLVAIGLMMLVAVLVVPRFMQIYAELGAALPLLSKYVFRASAFLSSWWPVLLIAIAGILACLFRPVFLTDMGKADWGVLRRLPLFASLFQYQNTSNFLSAMGMLLQKGVPMAEALGLSRMSLVSLQARQEVERAQTRLERGDHLGDILSSMEFMPTISAAMLRIGAERSDLPETMIEMAEYYEMKVDSLQININRLLEPIMIFLIAVFIGFFIIGMYLPLFSIVRIVG